jgi:predicted O-linked N-acetylglucosamine transferase (SPINDLY family)
VPLDPTILAALSAGQRGRPDEGIATLRRLLQRQPSNLQAGAALGQLLLQSGQFDQAIFQFQRCVQSAPKVPAHHNNLGMALWQAGRYRQAVPAFRESVRLDPAYTIGHIGLAMALISVSDFDGAAAAARTAIAQRPDVGEAYYNLGLALLEAGRIDDAVAALRQGVPRSPQNATLHSTLLIALNYRDYPADEVLREHREFARLHPPAAGLAPAATGPDPARRLRIGYLSRDLRNHSVGYFALAMVEHHDRANTEVFCYSGSAKDDAVTDRFKKAGDHWIDAARLDDAAIDRRIRADRIDILVELAGHSAGNRLPALAGKPAPIIITALGYPNTTGMPAVDYRLVDSLTDPPGAEAHATEALARLDPCFLCYAPPLAAPEQVAAPPGTAGAGPITFGSFNAIQKVSPEVVRAWAAILRRVPDSRLILKAGAFDHEPTRQRYLADFAAAGAPPDRLDFLRPTQSQAEHLALYARINIALDTFPYNGTTTTCESLWMGVPVVTLAGSRHAGRVGVSLLSAVGLPDLIASTAGHYTDLAAALAADPPRLAELRRTLRARMKASPLCDAPAYAAHLDALYRDLWRRWCARRSCSGGR